jgi:nucleoside-diphosphate-sugar epimerase
VRALITGVAGFIGSTLGEKLVSLGHEVVGVDCFTDYYARQRKEKNLMALREQPAFSLVEADVVRTDLAKLLDGVDAVFHQAAQAGVRASWGTTFESYVHHNVLGTQMLLEAVKKAKHVKRLVYASSSSIYGDTDDLPMREHSLPKPYSPYGVTKLAAENLCELYRNNFGVSTVSLRYFTVYGPRQRPDMAFNKFIRNLLADQPLSIFGSGKQTRDFTFVDDIVDANIAAAIEPKANGIYNIGGGSRVTLMEVLTTLAEVVGVKLRVEHLPEQAGDVKHTEADTSRARAELGYAPKIGLREGLTREVEWLKRDG